MKTKIISTLVFASLFANTPSTSAFLLTPLNEQMLRQVEINNEISEIRAKNDADERFEAMQRANRARVASMMENQEKIAENAPEENTLNDLERQAALSRPVIRIPLGTNIPVAIPEQREKVNNNIDMNRVEAAWLEWVNSVRAEQGLAPYTSHPLLSKTAQEWSDFSRDRGYTTHARPGDGCTGKTNYTCYNFKAIDEWFMNRGVNATVINRSKHTENVGFGRFSCSASASDCTDAAIRSIRKTFDFFYSEKKYNGSHYRSMVNPNFVNMGLGLAVKNGTYYVTIHYATPLK